MCASSKENIDLTILQDKEAFIVVRKRLFECDLKCQLTKKNLKEKSTYLESWLPCFDVCLSLCCGPCGSCGPKIVKSWKYSTLGGFTARRRCKKWEKWTSEGESEQERRIGGVLKPPATWRPPRCVAVCMRSGRYGKFADNFIIATPDISRSGRYSYGH